MTTHHNRQAIKQQRAALSPEVIAADSQAIAFKVFTLPDYLQADNIACYVAHRGEVDAQYIWDNAWQQKKSVFLPVLDPNRANHLVFVSYQRGDTLIANRFGILEPDMTAHTLIDPKALDVMIMPLLAFDAQGNRLGMGAGFYDRTLAFMRERLEKPKLIGLAYDFQQVDQILPEPWDIKLDCVITPSNPK